MVLLFLAAYAFNGDARSEDGAFVLASGGQAGNVILTEPFTGGFSSTFVFRIEAGEQLGDGLSFFVQRQGTAAFGQQLGSGGLFPGLQVQLRTRDENVLRLVSCDEECAEVSSALETLSDGALHDVEVRYEVSADAGRVSVWVDGVWEAELRTNLGADPFYLGLGASARAPATSTHVVATWTSSALATCTSDLDTDGVADCVDNCSDRSNADQTNQGEDALGDACDPCPLWDGTPTDVPGIPGGRPNCFVALGEAYDDPAFFDETPPTLALDDLPLITNAASVIVSGTAADVAPASGIARVEVKRNGALAGPWVRPPVFQTPATFSIEVPLDEGNNVLEVVAADYRLLTSNATTQIISDRTAPTATWTWPSRGRGIMVLTVEATDALSGVLSVTYTVGEVTTGAAPDAPGASSYNGQVDLTSLPNGAAKVVVTSTDRVGNVRTQNGTIIVDNPPPPPVPVRPDCNSCKDAAQGLFLSATVLLLRRRRHIC